MKKNGTKTVFTLLVGAVACLVCAASPALANPIAVSSYVYDGTGEGATPTNFFDTSGQELTDGVIASVAFTEDPWVGFRDGDDNDASTTQPQVTFDFGSAFDVASIDITYLHSVGVGIGQAGSSITAPESVLISVSSDNISYSLPTTFTTEFDDSDGDEVRVATLDVSALGDANYYRLDFRNTSRWTFLTEVAFDGVAGAPDVTPPTLASSDMVDDRGGASVDENTSVTYAVTFSEDMDAGTVTAVDFGNAGTSTVSFGAVIETGPGVFSVAVTPTSAGTLRLQVPAGAAMTDTAGNSLDAGFAIVDDTTITVIAAPLDTTAPAPDPMTFETPPYASSATSVAMEASAAADTAGVEYHFTETSGNPGGSDSGWQAGTSYEDGGLTTGLEYTYTVTARDLSANQNITAASAGASATAETLANPPSVITIASPSGRHIVQRSATDTGSIEISGSYTSVPSQIQARAVVMAGAGNSGTSIAWSIIDPAPAGSSFTGTLGGVPAGGWYQIEVRGLVGGAPGVATVLEKIGVGDIYVTAGQSNSANHGGPQYTPSDDRVSVRTTVSGAIWRHGFDSMPIATGTGGSVWSRLGDELAAADDIPIGFLCVGVGGSQVSSWVPGTSFYNDRLKPAVQSFPANGFRAVLWHQGESDSLASVSAATHAGRLGSMISQSRTDAGWDAPWFLAEVGFHPNSNLSQEEPVSAGQRATVHADPLTFLGPSTDEFHLEDAAGGKLNDAVHFNAVGLLDHAQQWRDILRGTTIIGPRNGGFEDNRSAAITGLAALADGASHIVTTASNNDSPSVLDWRILSAAGTAAADGSNGFYNPTTGTYAGAVDTVSGGVLPNMDGKHVAVLDGGGAGNYFLQSSRVLAEADKTYILTVAIGVRDDPANFGTARLEITANRAVVASAIFDKATLDALRGSDASGTFTDASISWNSGGAVAADQPVAIRIVKVGGTGTVLDFDQVRLSSATPAFGVWIGGFGLDPAAQGFVDDPDGDQLGNGLEAWFGTDPTRVGGGLVAGTTDGTTATFAHPQSLAIPPDVLGSYRWSPDLVTWYSSGGGPDGGPTVTIGANTIGSTTTVTATSSEPIPRMFMRALAIQSL